jgi:O-acetyl-ADP-ribose deacetylase (regulator of RNase III)
VKKNKKMNRLDFLIDYLINEDPQYSEMRIPEDLQGKRDLFRALRNVREPKPVSEEFLRLQDEELQSQLQEKGIVELDDCRDAIHRVRKPVHRVRIGNTELSLWQGDITRLRVDAIVNAANAQMLGCFHPLHKCIDNAIHSAAGVQLREECHRLMLQQGHPEPTGQAKITKAYNLPCKYVIHTVGPIIPNGIPTESQKDQLASCYRSIMACADEHGLESVAFCCISTGEFRFPNRLAAEIAVQTVKDYLNAHPGCSVKQVVFNVFKDEDKRIYEGI